MTSLQQSAGSGKAAKFVAANPLGPMANPFSDTVDDAASELREKMSADVDERLRTAVSELQEKHRTGTNDLDDEDRAPTGAAYQAQMKERADERRRRTAEERRRVLDQARVRREQKEEAQKLFADKESPSPNDDSSSVDSDDSLLDDHNDPALESLRQQRLNQLKQQQRQRADDLSRGHGQYRTISQDEFLPECTSSHHVVVHFFAEEFERCRIMDHHLRLVAPLHPGCKFVRIDAHKAPFFVAKLTVQTLPTLLVMEEGKVVDRLTGFAGLLRNPETDDPDKWHTGRLRQWLAGTGAIQYTIPTEEMREEMERLGLKPRGSVWSGGHGGAYEEE